MKNHILFFLFNLNCLFSSAQVLDSGSNFSFLRHIANESDVISLGEATHGDGTSFVKKIMFIKYLHDSCDYNVLAFESPYYDGNIANKNVLTIPNPFLKSIFGIWGTEELAELQKYILSTHNTARPLYFAGFDCQFGGYFSQNEHLSFWFPKLQDTIQKMFPLKYQKDSSTGFYAALKKQVRISGKFNTIEDADTVLLHKELFKILAFIQSDTHSYFRFWNQTIKCLIVNYRISNLKAFNSGMRDSMMYENFEEVKNDHQGSKIIIWAATDHSSFRSVKLPLDYYTKKSMGTYLKEKYGSKYYAISFSSYEGKIGTSDLLLYTLKKSTAQSFEGEMQKLTDSVEMFVNFRNTANKEYFEKRISSSRLLFSEEIAVQPWWLVDGAYYFKSMKRPKHLRGRYKYQY